jgi:hypothetical protein
MALRHIHGTEAEIIQRSGRYRENLGVISYPIFVFKCKYPEKSGISDEPLAYKY